MATERHGDGEAWRRRGVATERRGDRVEWQPSGMATEWDGNRVGWQPKGTATEAQKGGAEEIERDTLPRGVSVFSGVWFMRV